MPSTTTKTTKKRAAKPTAKKKLSPDDNLKQRRGETFDEYHARIMGRVHEAFARARQEQERAA